MCSKLPYESRPFRIWKKKYKKIKQNQYVFNPEKSVNKNFPSINRDSWSFLWQIRVVKSVFITVDLTIMEEIILIFKVPSSSLKCTSAV